MKIIYSKYIPPKGYRAINLFGIVVIAKRHMEAFIRFPHLLEKLSRHEYIHTMQGREMFWVFFYIWYGIEWVVRLIEYRNRGKAYRNISFEREAYANMYNEAYLKDRKVYNWKVYIKK